MRIKTLLFALLFFIVIFSCEPIYLKWYAPLIGRSDVAGFLFVMGIVVLLIGLAVLAVKSETHEK